MVRKHARSFDLFSSYSYYLPGWGGLFGLVAFFVLGAVLGAVVFTILQWLLTPEAVSDYQILIVYPLQFIPAMIYASAKSHANETFDNEGTPLDSKRFAPIGPFWMAVMAVVSTLACAIVVEPAGALLPDMPESLKQTMEMLAGGPLWVSLLTTAVFAPFFEEWLCRGMILRGMLKKYSPCTAIVISSVFFAVIHMNPWQAIPAFLLGCLFGLVYYKTGSLKLTMLMHCANNAMSVLLTRIPGADGKEYIWQFFGDALSWQYGILYVMALSLVVLMVTRLVTTSFKDNL